MTDQDYRDVIARDWLAKAETALRTAEVLLEEQLLVGSVNRLYYAAFYAVSAVLAKEGTEYGKHRAVRAALHRDYVKPGRIPAGCGRTYDRLFEDRQRGDYTPRTSFNPDEVRELLLDTKKFLDCFRELLR